MAKEFTVQTITLSPALAFSTGTADATDNNFVNDGRTFIYISQTTGVAQTLTVDNVVACSFGVDDNVTQTLNNAQIYLIGPFPPGRFNSLVDGKCHFTVTGAVGSYNIACVRLPLAPVVS